MQPGITQIINKITGFWIGWRLWLRGFWPWPWAVGNRQINKALYICARVCPGWDDEADEFDFTALPPVTPDPAPGEDWEGKYNELKSRYISRFFTGGEGDNGESDTNGETTPEQVKVVFFFKQKTAYEIS